MRTIPLIAAAILAGCATPTPYDQVVDQAFWGTKWVDQTGNDPIKFGCSPQGDCDDRAMCAACRLVQAGSNPADIIVVVEGWDRFNKMNHMSLEYKGYCLMGYGANAYQGQCKHRYADKNMTVTRTPLPAYLKRTNAEMACEGFEGGF